MDDRVAPYGRSFEEYCAMFDLTERVRGARILGVGDGASNFNARATRAGWRVVSMDPIYRLPPGQLERDCLDSLDRMLEAASLTPTHWIWAWHSDLPSLRRRRMDTAAEFFADLPGGALQGRYVAASLPSLPFASDTFDIALSSHLLFSWSGVLDLEFHVRAVDDMLRVASRVVIVPTGRNLGTRRSDCAVRVAETFASRGCDVSFGSMAGLSHNATTERLMIARR